MNKQELIDNCIETIEDQVLLLDKDEIESAINTSLSIAFAYGSQCAKSACRDAIKPFIHQHIVIQELRDLYLSKIDNVEVLWTTPTEN